VKRRPGAAAATALCALAACGTGTPDNLADRSSTEVRQEERRLGVVLAAGLPDLRTGTPGETTACQVRLLRQEDTTSYVYAVCETTGAAGGVQPSTASPFRIEGTKVDSPNPIDDTDESLREIFPADLVEYVNHKGFGLKP
jgi:hypothetical protein